MANIVTKKLDLLSDKSNLKYVNWKSVDLLEKYITRFDEIKKRSFSKHWVAAQKYLRKQIIRAREIGLLPYTK